MNEKQVFICENHLQGILTGVYVAWDSRCGHENVELRVQEPENLEFFCHYHKVPPDSDKAWKVIRTIRRDLGDDVYEFICFAAAAKDEEKGTAIYQTLVEALSRGRKNRRVLENLANPYVHRVFLLHRKVWYELERLYGFVRFRQMPGGILFARIHPDNDLLTLMDDHFSNRYPRENWVIYDEKRMAALVHPRDGSSYLRIGVKLPEDPREELSHPEEYEILWKEFCKSIAVMERKNLRLQQQHVPLKYRDRMLEFEEEGAASSAAGAWKE